MARVQDLIERFYFGVPIGQRSLEAAIRDALSQKQTFALDAGCGIDAPLTRKFGNRVRVVGLDLCRSSSRFTSCHGRSFAVTVSCRRLLADLLLQPSLHVVLQRSAD